MIYIYRVLYFLLSYFVILTKSLWPKSFQQWIALRQMPLPDNLKPKCIWFHASSGEIEYSKAIIREIKKRHPEVSIVVTYSSPSALKLFWNIQDLVAHFIPLPWDRPNDLEKMIRYLQPRILIFSRTDFWFELITQIHKHHIPMVAVSTFPRFSPLANFWHRLTLSKMKLITTVRSDLTTKLKEVLPPEVRIKTLNDTRFDQVLYRLSQKSKVSIQSEDKVVVFASTWPEDDQHLMTVADFWLQQGQSLVWCPHDVTAENVARLQTLVQPHQAVLFSALDPMNIQLKNQILILDKIGYLADIYRFTEWAFVGGSFKAKVHSVMEPLCATNPVFVGPYYQNSPEALAFVEKKLVFPIENADQLLKTLQKTAMVDLHATLRKEVSTYHNSSQEAATDILDLVLKNVNS